MNYALDQDGNITVSRELGQHTLVFTAADIRRTASGIHARVSIDLDSISLAWALFNIERDEDRVRLANSAFRHFGDQPLLGANDLKHSLDVFCRGLWQERVRGLLPNIEPGTHPAPIRFLLRPFVMAAGGTLLFAPPGVGKSYTALLQAVSIDAGISELWPVPHPAKVLVINLERSRETYANRLGCTNRALGLPEDRPLLIQNARGMSLSDVIEAAARAVREQGVEVVFLDSISRSGFGDLNENSTANKISDVLNRLCQAWVAIAHTPRSDDGHVYGSVHFDAAADLMVRLAAADADHGSAKGISLQIGKANDLGPQPMSIISLTFDESGLYMVRDATPGEFPGLEEQEAKSLRQRLAAYALEHGRVNATIAARDLEASRTEISRLLNQSTDYVSLGKDGRDHWFGRLAEGM